MIFSWGPRATAACCPAALGHWTVNVHSPCVLSDMVERENTGTRVAHHHVCWVVLGPAICLRLLLAGSWRHDLERGELALYLVHATLLGPWTQGGHCTEADFS